MSDIELRPEVRAFAEKVEMRLRRHDDDRGDSWKTMTDQESISYLIQRVALLVTTITEMNANPITENYNEAVKQAASVGAAAMFVSDNLG